MELAGGFSFLIPTSPHNVREAEHVIGCSKKISSLTLSLSLSLSRSLSFPLSCLSLVSWTPAASVATTAQQGAPSLSR